MNDLLASRPLPCATHCRRPCPRQPRPNVSITLRNHGVCLVEGDVWLNGRRRRQRSGLISGWLGLAELPPVIEEIVGGGVMGETTPTLPARTLPEPTPPHRPWTPKGWPEMDRKSKTKAWSLRKAFFSWISAPDLVSKAVVFYRSQKPDFCTSTIQIFLRAKKALNPISEPSRGPPCVGGISR